MIAWRSRLAGVVLLGVASFAGCQLVSGVDSVEYEDDGSGAGTTAAETTASAAATTSASGMGGAGGSSTSSRMTTSTTSMAETSSTGSATSPCNDNGTCDGNETRCLCPLECLEDLSCQNGCCDASADTSACGAGNNLDCQAVPNCTDNSGQDCPTEVMNCGNCTSCKCPDGQHCAFVSDLGHHDCVD